MRTQAVPGISTRRLLVLPLVVLAAFLLFLAWLAVSASMARGHLVQVQTQLNKLQLDVDAGRTAQLDDAVRAIQRDAASARQLTSGTSWRLAARLPLVGPTATTVTGLASATDDFSTNALPELIAAETDMQASFTAGANGTVDLALLGRASRHLDVAQGRLAAVRGHLGGLPDAGVVGSVRVAARGMQDELRQLVDELDQTRDEAQSQVQSPAPVDGTASATATG